MKALKIEVVQNGFIVSEQQQHQQQQPFACEDPHVFQSAQGLAEHVHKWGEENKKKPASTVPLKKESVIDNHCV